MVKKTVEDFFSHDYVIKCKGRGIHGEELSDMEPIEVNVHIYKSPDSNVISSDIGDCEYNCGSHGQNCSAFTEGVSPNAICCYAFDLPCDFNKK